MRNEKVNVFGIVSLILGIAGILLSCIAIGLYPSILGAVLGLIGITRKNSKRGTATAGFICSVIGIIMFLLFSFVFVSIFGNDKEKDSQKTNSSVEAENNQGKENNDSSEKVFKVGDVVETEELKISFLSANEYTDENQFVTPKEGNVFYKLEFEFENISDSDQSVSTMADWECYADSYKADQQWIGNDNGLDATLSSGKKTKGSVFFEVPANAQEITLEYKTNFFSEEKIEFIVK